jgi:hypothetical protein
MAEALAAARGRREHANAMLKKMEGIAGTTISSAGEP